MGLAKLLSERVGINLLNEVYGRGQTPSQDPPSFSLADIESRLHQKIDAQTLRLLSDHGLITITQREKPSIRAPEIHIQITTKGKLFIDAFDRVRTVFYEKDTSLQVDQGKRNTKQKPHRNPVPPTIDIEYVLTDLEEKILEAIFTLGSHTHQAVSPQEIIRILYPHDVYQKKISIISHYTKKLEELKLIKKVKENRHTLLYITPSGERTVRRASSQTLH